MMIAVTIRVLMMLALLPNDAVPSAQHPTRVVHLIAGRNSTFRIESPKSSELDLLPDELITLHVEAQKAKSMNRDGSVHGLVLLDSHRKPVPGWELLFKPGVQEIQLNAPAEPGIYEAICTVICSTDHEHMKFRVVVRPK